MSKTPNFPRRRYLDLATGCMVRFSPSPERVYRVLSITGPFTFYRSSTLTVWPYPIVSLVCDVPAPSHEGERGHFHLNDFHRDEAARLWVSDQGHTLIVLPDAAQPPPPPAEPAQLDLFAALEPAPALSADGYEELTAPPPYVFQEGIDYRYDGDTRAWNCARCGRDFVVSSEANAPRCPHCRAADTRWVLVMPPTAPGQRRWSSYQRELGYTGDPV